MSVPTNRQETHMTNHYAMRTMSFAPWWRAVNQALEDQGRAQILLSLASAWWAEGLSPGEAVQRQLENLESSQEERSYYDA